MNQPSALEEARPPKAVSRRNVRSRRRCLGCPFCAPSGKCLDPRRRSGRCGDWVFYVLHGKQLRRLDVKPRDPRTPSQVYWRQRLAAASRSYSAALSDAEQNACIAAGAKRRSRKRLGQSGRLTGQQYWVSKECIGLPEADVPKVQPASGPLQTKGISAPPWEPHRDTSVTTPYQHRRDTRRACPQGQKPETRRPKPERIPNAEGAKAPNRRGATVWDIPRFDLRGSFGLRPSAFEFPNRCPCVSACPLPAPRKAHAPGTRLPQTRRQGAGRWAALARDSPPRAQPERHRPASRQA